MTEKESTAARPRTASLFSVTNTLVVLNFVLFVLVVVVVARARPQWDLLNKGSDLAPLALNSEPWRLLTSMFLHISGLHLLGNLLFLWILGRRLERILGKWIFLFFYLSCGIAGSLVGIAYDPEHATCGASSAILGLAGGLISIYSLKGLTLSKRGRFKLALLILWTAYSIYPDASTAKLSVVSHVAGFVTGLGLGAVLAAGLAETRRLRRRVLAGTLLFLLLGAISVREYKGYLIPLGAGMRALNVGRVNDALRDLHVALQQKPNSLLANIALTETYTKKEDYPNAEAAVRHALAIEPTDEHATYLLGMVRLHRGYCEEAHDIGASLWAQSRDEEYKRKAWPLSIVPCDRAGSGDRAFSEGKLDFAMSLYNMALHEDPNNYRAQMGLAKVYQAKGMQKEADAAAAKAAAMRPQTTQ